jgi:hypothetical protein
MQGKRGGAERKEGGAGAGRMVAERNLRGTESKRRDAGAGRVVTYRALPGRVRVQVVDRSGQGVRSFTEVVGANNFWQHFPYEGRRARGVTPDLGIWWKAGCSCSAAERGRVLARGSGVVVGVRREFEV